MYTSVVTADVQDGLEFAADCHDFWQDSETLLFIEDHGDARLLLEKLTYKVSRKPGDLLAHLRRIYCCYQNQLPLPLYAALLDFFIVLNGKGNQLSQRILAGCASRLDPRVYNALKTFHTLPGDLPGNVFSLFTTGIIGSAHIVDYAHQGHVEHDFMTLAHDFIEYSQLDQAMEIIEHGLQEEPEHMEAQAMLLQLYRSTDSRDRFAKRYQLLLGCNAPLIEGWAVLGQFFDEK